MHNHYSIPPRPWLLRAGSPSQQRKRSRKIPFKAVAVEIAVALSVILPGSAQTFTFSTGDPDGKLATASRPSSPGNLEIETADDFKPSTAVTINQATFTGLLPTGAALSDVSQVIIEIYRVFPNDSLNPPSGNVPTRVNSPADTALLTRDSAAATLSFSTTLLNQTFSAQNSILGQIHAFPNQTTHGEGAVTGQEVRFNVTFTDPISLSADHYFFVPQVELNTGDFYWLSAPKPIVAPGTPFSPDLQSWIRNGDLDPDWLRAGTDIIGGSPAPTFNAAFSLSGTVPEAGPTAGLLALAMGVLAGGARRWRTAG